CCHVCTLPTPHLPRPPHAPPPVLPTPLSSLPLEHPPVFDCPPPPRKRGPRPESVRGGLCLHGAAFGAQHADTRRRSRAPGKPRRRGAQLRCLRWSSGSLHHPGRRSSRV